MKIDLNLECNFSGLGVSIYDGKPTIYYCSESSDGFLSAQSSEGTEFEKTDTKFIILGLEGNPVDIKSIQKIRTSPIFKDHILFFEQHNLQQKVGGKKNTYVALTKDQITWQVVMKLPEEIGVGLNVENYVYKNQHVFYFGGPNIKIGLTDTGDNWQFMDVTLKDGENFEIDYTLKTSQGIFVLYHHYSLINSKRHLEIKAVCFDKNDPTRVVWLTNSSLWEEPSFWAEKEANCMGCLLFGGELFSYWNVPGIGIFTVTYPFYDETPAHEHQHYRLEKHLKNPILTPIAGNEWEDEATFNPAAFYEDGKVYLIYRAVGHDYVSVLGYAESTDGIHFKNRLSKPIFAGNHNFDVRSPRSNALTVNKFMSGGGYGGCEDPRITKINDRLYMVYVAFNGYSEPRLAITSILYDNFIKHRFLWEKPVLISPPGIIDKSGCVLPEKINGKFVIFHRIYPNILIDFVDNLNFDGKTYLKGEFKIEPRPTMWDSRKIGTGAPPLKTKHGWLLIYQAVTDRDDSKYKIGAMLLDLADPTKVLYRSNQPIIEPTEHYENGLSKFGVVYPCGAVIVGEDLLVYYGGSDSVTCVASANLEEFLNELMSGNGAHMAPIKIND